MVDQDSGLGSDGSLSGSDLTIQLLTGSSAFAQFSRNEAAVVVGFMKPARFEAGTCFITEGDVTDTGVMALVLQGEVIVENLIVSRTAPITTAVLGLGCLVGEIGLIDEGPRSASCIAGTDLYCAVLTREAFYSLIVKEPALGAKLMLGVSVRIAERARETARKLKIYAKLCQAMQAEINVLLR